MFDRLGTTVSGRWAWVLAGWAILVLVVQLLAPRWDDVALDGDLAYLPERMNSVRGQRLLDEGFPENSSKSEVIIVVARSGNRLQQPDYRVADHLLARLTSAPIPGPILHVVSHRTEVLGQNLVSRVGPNGQALLIVLQLSNEFMAVANLELLERIGAMLDAARHEPDFPPGLEVGVTGSAAIGSDMLRSGEESVRNTERATVLLVIVILLVVYRAPGLVLVPLVAIFASLAVALGLVASLAALSDRFGWFDFTVFTATKIFIVVVLFGAGTDFCLFLVARYQEELESGLSPAVAIARALGCVGHVIAASAMTTILGLGTMALAEFGKSRHGGPTVALCLAVALMASITLAPALIRAGGLWVFWPMRPAHAERSASERRSPASDAATKGRTAFDGFWDGLSRQIIAHPGLILGGSLLLLSPLALHGFGVEATYDLPSELQPECPSVAGMKLLQRHFSPGETGPITVLVYQRQGGLTSGESLWEQLGSLSQDLYQWEFTESDGTVVRPILRVHSLAHPLGESPRRYGLRGGLRIAALRNHPLVQRVYLAQTPEYAGRLTRLDVVTAYAPFSAESIRLLDALDRHLAARDADPHSPWHGAEFYFVGATAGIRNLQTVTNSDLLRIKILVTVAVLTVLILILRRPLVSTYLVLSVLLGYYVSLGTADLAFRWFYGETFQGLDWQVPIFLFVFLVALGEDYNIYLVTRIQEEQARHGPKQGLRVALRRTGGIITSCGVIMAGTFASMITGTLRTVQEFGVAFSFGILLDTFVIRTILVPAFLVLWDRVVPPQGPTESSDSTAPKG